jgi:hypothetical protein
MHRLKAALLVIPPTVGALILAIPMVAGGAPPGSTHPPGNNGTVKVDALPWDDHPDNEPHVGCVFEIDLYNYEQGDLWATYAFELWSPTGSGSLHDGEVFVGEDANGGGTDLDASTGPIDLSASLAASGAAPHPNQGFHVKLTVHADGSIGADVKHKVFWVTGCAAAESESPSVAPSESESPSVAPSESESPSETETSSPPGVGAGGGSTSSPTVLGESGTSPPGSAAFTGGEGIPWLVGAGMVFLLLGTLALRLGSRPHQSRPTDRSA